MKRVLIIGCGAHGRIVAETLVLCGGFEVAGFGDDNPAKFGLAIDRWKVLGNWREIEADAYFVAVGLNDQRKKIFDELTSRSREVLTIVHPRAYVSPAAAILPGTVILAGAVVSAGARVGRNAIINVGAVVDHDATVGDHAHVAQNATVASFGQVAEGEMLAPGAVRLRPK